MAIGYLTLSSNQAGAISTWTCVMYPDGPAYTTPTWGGQAITVTVPAEMQGATFNSATLSYNVSSVSGTKYVRYNGEGVSVTSANLLERLTAGGNLDLYFSFKASGGTGSEGTHSASCTWSNITITVDYTPSTGLRGSRTVSGAGVVTYSLERASLAYGESMTFSMTVQPTIAIKRVAAVIYPGALNPGINVATDKNIAANGAASFSYTIQITDEVYAAMTQRRHLAQMNIILTGSDGTTYSTGRVPCQDATSKERFKLLQSRQTPVISAVTVSESGTNHLSTYGNLIAGKTIPVISFSVTLDDEADDNISVESRYVEVENRRYTLSANSGTLEAIQTSGSVAYTISLTDSYGQTGTVSGAITVLAYTPPTLKNVAISRYIATLDSQGATVYELNDDGTSLWFDGAIAVQTTLGTDSNLWSLKITPMGGSTITAVSNSKTASVTYTHNRTFITASYANTASFDFTVALSDVFTTVTYSITVPKAGGIFNIETSGVAVGMRSTGTDAVPIFESAYPAYMRAGVYGADGSRLDEVHDTGWIALTLTNCAQASGWAACAVRVLNGVVYVRGAVTLSANMTSSASASRQLTTLPAGARPAANMLVNSGARANYSEIEIDADGAVKLWNRIGSAIGTSEVVSISAVFPCD